MRNALLGDGLYLLNFWGRDAAIVKERCGVPVGGEYGSFYARFETEQARTEFIEQINRDGLFVVTDTQDGENTLYRTVAVCRFEYNGSEYEIERDFGFGYPEDSARFMFTEGNYGCDCNRSSFIAEKYDEFEEMDCGERIKLIELNIQLRPE